MAAKVYPAGVWLSLAVIVFSSNHLNAAFSEAPQTSHLPQPQLNLKPEQVVRIVIEALANNDSPYADAGIATAFNFASPANKVSTGPLKRFTSMVNAGYGLMLNHLSSEFSELVIKDSVAYQMVKLMAHNGTQVVYAFRLSQQTQGEFEGMWMTDAVWEVSKRKAY